MVANHEATGPARVGAFFDVDRTLLRGSSMIHLVRPMRRAGLLPTRALLRSLVVQARFARSGFDEQQIREGVRGVGSLVAGLSADDLAGFADQVIPTGVLPRVYSEARSRLTWHRARGHRVFLVSSSPRQFIAVLGAALGVDDVAATEAEIRDGHYTGNIIRFCHGPAKAESVRDLATRHDLNLAESYAYGDSLVSDVAMMEMVGHPVCVNGDAGLVAEALSRGWAIETFGRSGPSPRSATLRRLPAGVLVRSVPAVRRARRHVRSAGRSLRHL